ncbi:hypothetical protein [Pedobacter panaciterrae]
MKSALDGVVVVVSYLSVLELTSAITGAIYENNERGNSKLADVCVNAITIDDSQRQKGTINVNVYAPDIKKKIGNEFVPVADKTRLKATVNIIKGLLGEKKGKYFYGGNLWISNISGAIQEKEINQHKINIRVEIRFNN